MKRNHSEYQAMVMGHKVNPEFRWERNIIPNSDVLQMLRVTVDDMFKFDSKLPISVEKNLNKLQF